MQNKGEVSKEEFNPRTKLNANLDDSSDLDESSDSLISIPESMNQDGLIDLIDQPAWKSILIELVKKERMDPWSIDISDLTVKYIAKINSLSSTDLRLPANAILASALLLKFKSNVLKISDIEDEDEFLEQKKGMSAEEKLEFEALLPDLQSIHRIKEGKVSLDALVSSIELMLKSTKKTKDKKFLNRERTKFQIPLPDFKIDEAMNKVFNLIQKNSDSEGLILFSRLVNENSSNKSIVRTFIPCLFLTNNGKINMWQDDFFGEIFLSIPKE